MSTKHLAACATLALALAVGGRPAARAAARAVGEPETVMVTLHAKAGADTELAGVLARHWAVARRLHLVEDAPHVTIRGSEPGGRAYFVDIFTWRDAGIPDAAPREIQAIWGEMNRLVEPREGRPGLDIVPVTLVARP